MEKQIYNHEQEFKKLYQDRIIGNQSLTEANREALVDFFNILEAENLTYARRKKLLLFTLQIIGWLKKDLVKTTKEDLIALVGTINRQGYAEWTARDYKIITKKLYQTLSTIDKYKAIEPLYFWLYDKRTKFFSGSIDKNAGTDKDWFNDEDVKGIISAADNIRDKCFFTILASQGMRPEEILTLKTKDVIKIENGIQIKISKGKTGDRVVFVYEGHVINSILEYLIQKQKNSGNESKDEKKKGGDTYLFDFKLRNAQKILKKLAEKAGITKRAYLYKFRKFAVTQDRIRGVSTGALEAKFGWRKGTDVIKHYDKSISIDYKREMMAKFGLVKEEVKTGFEERTCSRCGQKCAYNLEYCTKCGLNLNITHEELMKNTSNTQKENQELKARIDKLEKVFECLVGNPEIKKIVSKPDFMQ